MPNLSLNRRCLLRLSAMAMGIVGLDTLIGNDGIVDATVWQSGSVEQSFLNKKADVRQIWDFTAVDQAQSGVIAMRNAMNAFQFSYHKSHYLIGNLRGTAVVFGLNDKMWEKYTLSKYFNVASRGRHLTFNPLYRRTATDNRALPPDVAGSFYSDVSLQVLQQRGAHIAVCHDALRGTADRLLNGACPCTGGPTPESVYKELAANLVPAAQVTPSGGALIAIAQQLGFTYAKQ